MVPNSNILDSKRSGHGARITEDNYMRIRIDAPKEFLDICFDM